MLLQRLSLLFVVVFIFAMGLVVIFSTTSAEIIDLQLNQRSYQPLLKQLVFALFGLALATAIWRTGYRNFLKISPVLLAVFIFILLLTLIPGIGREVNGSRRWIGFAGLYFQPSEFVKYVVPAYFIYYYQTLKPENFTLKKGLLLLGTIALPIVLIMVEPNNGTAGVIALSIIILCFLLRIKFKYWALPLIICVVVGGLFAANLNYVSARLKVYLNPESDIRGRGHQPYQAKIAAGSGQLTGKGPGKSWQKLSYLPEAQNDYIAAIFAEEYGFLGVLVLISLYMTIGLIGFGIASKAPDRSGFYLASTITFLITFQAFLNLGVVSGLLPSTGLNLPFFSQGGTSLMANIMGIGLLLNISAQSNVALKK